MSSTDTEAQAICEMIELLTGDGYGLAIYRASDTDEVDGETFNPFIVQAIRFIGEDRVAEVASAGRARRLIDALQDAYQLAPEPK